MRRNPDVVVAPTVVGLSVTATRTWIFRVGVRVTVAVDGAIVELTPPAPARGRAVGIVDGADDWVGWADGDMETEGDSVGTELAEGACELDGAAEADGATETDGLHVGKRLGAAVRTCDGMDDVGCGERVGLPDG